MKKILLGVLFLCICFLQANAKRDTLQYNQYVMRATLYGIGHTNILDTYLSPMEYIGPEFRILRENMRKTKHLKDKISRQSLFQANISMTENLAGTGSEFSFLANWNLAYHYSFCINEDLTILTGPNFDLNGGMIYNLRNSNNPINAKLYTNLGASGIAMYRFRIKGHPFTLRYQLNIPLLGIMFSPEYGQPYYDMSLSSDWNKNINFTSIHNQPSLRQFLTLDFPIESTNLRIGYVCDIQQAKVNNLKSHIWSHTLMLGFVKYFQTVSPF